MARIAAVCACLLATAPALAAGCNYATSQGQTGPTTWQTYCWIDFSAYNDATATSPSGQNFSITLQDGSVIAFNLQVSTPAPLHAVPVPSWTGAAFGNSAFLGIGGKAVLYQTGAGTSTLTFSNITVTPPAGASSATAFAFVAGDGESTNGGESLSFNTNGGAWTQLDQAGPITGSSYPTLTGVGSSTVSEGGLAGSVGAYIFGSNSPTTVVATLVGSGLQGAVFAVRFATLRLNTVISGTRVVAADQFKYSITATSGGATLATGTSSGTGLGPFTAAPLSAASGLPMTLTQAMATGSTSAIAKYQSLLSCTNSTAGSSTPLPTNVTTTSYSFGQMQFGDEVYCTYTETPFPELTLTKALGSNGRLNPTDEFTVNILNGATTVATTTTTGTGTTVNNASTAQTQVTPGTTYTLAEAAAGTTTLSKYAPSLACTNADASSTTALPASAGGTIKPAMGDVVACTLTNTLVTSGAALTILKTASVLSDPINGSTNPKAIPGAIVQYTLLVTNTGTGMPDSNSVFLADKLPSQVQVGTASNPTFSDGSPSSGLTMAPANVKYSRSAIAPTSIAGCTYTPVSAYDAAVKYICFNPQGAMKGFTTGAANFSISFQSQLQ